MCEITDPMHTCQRGMYLSQKLMLAMVEQVRNTVRWWDMALDYTEAVTAAHALLTMLS